MIVLRHGHMKGSGSVRTESRLRLLLVSMVAWLLLGGCGGDRTTDVPGGASGVGIAPGVSEEQLRDACEHSNIVICVLDAVRADHVGCYGYPRETTPTIDRLSSTAVVLESHFAQSPMTRISTVSLLSGLYPDTHLASTYRAVRPEMFTLEKALRTAAISTGLFSANVYASPMTGVGLDFDVARTTHSRFGTTAGNPSQPHLGIGGPEGEDSPYDPGRVLTLFEDWLHGIPGQRFFAYIHIMPPHTPYAAPRETKELFADETPPSAWTGDFPFPGLEPKLEKQERLPLSQWVNLYDANVRWADTGVDELLRILSDTGVLEDTLVIVTSDHGEAFGEHGYLYHSFGVYDELLRVPLLIRFPRGRVVGRLNALTETVDVTPTICDLLEIPYPDTVQGRSLVPLLTGERSETRDCVFARALGETPSYLIRTKDHAMVLYYGGVKRALYDLTEDPRQITNVLDDQPEDASRLLARFRGFAETQALKPMDFLDPKAAAVPPARPSPSIPISEETKQELRALGYIQ